MQEPSKQEGILLKRRKWPMKGWHKVSAPPGPEVAANPLLINVITRATSLLGSRPGFLNWWSVCVFSS